MIFPDYTFCASTMHDSSWEFVWSLLKTLVEGNFNLTRVSSEMKTSKSSKMKFGK